jgi:membrane-bound lytic murein transglycosylase F
MRKLKRIVKLLVLPVFLLFFMMNCKHTPEVKKETKPVVKSLEEIKQRGELVAITDYNSTNYFVYRGKTMGYQYDLLRQFAQYLGVKLKVKVSNNLQKNFQQLESGECDLLAVNLTVTKERSKRILFSQSIHETRQVLVQRKPDHWRKMSRRQVESKLLRNQLDLGEKIVYVQENSAYAKRLNHLSEEIGDSIQVIEMPEYESEQLIQLVARGEIDYTVCDEDIAKVNRTYYPNIDVKTAISFPQRIAWGLNKESGSLQQELNKWLVNFKKTKKYRRIYAKYFENSKSVSIINSDYYANESGKISRYDNYLKKFSKEINWDWRLLAALVYQESRFNPQAKSWAGAYGLMQLMPETGKHFGVTFQSPVEAQIRAGVQFIDWLNKRLDDQIFDQDEKIKFILASYNVGLGHVLDARRLAVKNGKNPDQWEDNVDYYILNKSKPKYYLDSVVQFGYCRGEETYNYVNQIMDRYHHYVNILPES